MTAATFTQALRIDPAPFIRRDKAGLARLELAVKGMRCAGCIAKIERGMTSLPGVEDARVNLSTAKLSVRWREGQASAEKIIRRLGELGFQAFPYDPESLTKREDDEGRFLLRCLAVAGFAASNVMFLSISVWSGLDGEMGDATRTMLHWLSGLIAVPAALYAGRPFFRSALESLRAGRANMDVPIAVAIVLALGLSIAETLRGGHYAYFDAAVSLPFLLLIGRYLDHLLRRNAGEAARDLIAMQTATATRIASDGATASVAPRDIAIGDRLLVVAGERTPVDGVVETGASSADLSLVTGETMPVPVATGGVLRAGALILGHAVTLRATARAEDSLVAELTRLLEAGQQTRNRYVRLADHAARLYVPLVHGTAALVFIGGMLFGLEAHAALTNAIALLIITCPCALGLAVPAVQIVATGRLFRRGILVKSGDALERLAEIDTVVFDKTGTLTRGAPSVVEPAALPSGVLEGAARLARASAHPLARAIAGAAGEGPLAANVTETPGDGLEGVDGGARVRLGNAAWIGADPSADDSGVWYRVGDDAAVHIALEDDVMPDAAHTVALLVGHGLRIEMLSGDRAATAARIARACGISDWRADIDPAAKVRHLETLRAAGRRTLMVGDGLNDAAALSVAHVSISPATAINVAQAAADMILTAGKLSPIVAALDVARAARQRVFENFAFAALYNVLAVPLAAMGMVTPLIAAVAMSLSSLVVMLNALRLPAKG